MQNDPLMGKQFGDFVIQDRIGKGGMATVYRARQQSVNRDVALKIINLNQPGITDEFKRRFANEANIIASLEHLHILPVYAYGIDDDYAYIAMRLLRGGSVREVIRANPRGMPMEQAISIFRQAAQGLAFAHSKGVIHRDIKPANILLDDNGNAFISDFGLAKAANSAEMTQTDTIVGTVAYMSPEQLRGERLDQRADVYAMGCMLFEMLTGRPPFTSELGEDLVGVMYKHLEQVPPSLLDINSAFDPTMNAAVQRALAKDRASRYENMGQFASHVEQASGLSFSSASYPPVAANLQLSGSYNRITRPSQVTVSQRSANTTLGVALALVVIAVIALAVALLAVTGGSNENANATATAASIQAAADATSTSIASLVFEVQTGITADYERSIPSEQQIRLAQIRLEQGFVAVLPCTLDTEYHATLTREVTGHLREYGLTFEVFDANTDAYQQRTLLEQAQAKGASAFIICPLDMAQLEDALGDISAQGLPIASLNPLPEGINGVNTTQTGSNADMGEKMGRGAGAWIRDNLDGEAQVILIDFPDMEAIVERTEGIQAGIRELAPNVEFVGNGKGGTREFAYASVQKLLASGVEFNVVASINDAGALGAIQALEEAGIAPDAVHVFGIDAEELALQYIRDGYYMRGTLEVGRANTSQSLAGATVLMLAGAEVPAAFDIPFGDFITLDNLTQ